MSDVLIFTGPVSSAMLDPLADVPEGRRSELRAMFGSSTNAADFDAAAKALEGNHYARKALELRASEINDGLKCSSIAPLVLLFDRWKLKTYNQPDKNNTKRIGSVAFGEWANTLGDDPLTALAGKDATRIVMVGFSAAHGAHERILGQVAKRRDSRLVGLFAGDSYYSSWGVQTPKPGHRAWLRMAIENQLPAWFTTSTRHPKEHPSATESFLVMANSLGMLPVSYEGELTNAGIPDPRSVRAQGTVRWFEYGDSLAHEAHALKLAPIAVTKGPFLRAVRPPQTTKVPNALAHKPAPAPTPAPTPTESGSNAGRNVLLGITVLGLGYLISKAAG